MKKINSETISARNADMQQTIGNARFFETLNNAGRSQEDILEEARTYLSITENDSIIASSDDKVKELNVLTRNLIDINSLTNRLNDANILEEGDLEVLQKLESKLAEQVKAIYGIEDSDLYE